MIVEPSEVIAVGGICNVVSFGGQGTDVCDDRLQLVDILASEQHLVADDGFTEESTERVPSLEGQEQGVRPDIDHYAEPRRILGATCIETRTVQAAPLLDVLVNGARLQVGIECLLHGDHLHQRQLDGQEVLLGEAPAVTAVHALQQWHFLAA